VLLICVFIVSQVVDFKVNKEKINNIIEAGRKHLPIQIKDSDSDMVGITIYYPTGNTRRIVISIEHRDLIIDRQLRDQDISDLVPRENNIN
jgi:hypothetical protein